MSAAPGSAQQYSQLLLDYLGMKLNEVIPNILFGHGGQEFYLTKLLNEMVRLKHDGFLKSVLTAPAMTHKRFLA